MDFDFLKKYGVELLEKVGEGSFGKVYKGLYQDQHIAIKINTGSVLEEVSILEQINHERVIKLIGYCKHNTTQYLMMEYAQGGSISNYDLQRHGEQTLSKLMKNLLHAVQYIHLHNIVHRDIKPDNILVINQDDITNIKLADFGLSFQHTEDAKYAPMSQKCGSLIFMAPEQLQNLPYSKSVDMWSCGIVLYMFLTGEHPYYPRLKTKQEMIEGLSHFKVDDIKCSSMARDLVRRLLCVNNSERYTATQALNHPWITQRYHDPIPMSIQELAKVNILREQMIKKFKAILLLRFMEAVSQDMNDASYFEQIDTIQEVEECSPYLEVRLYDHKHIQPIQLRSPNSFIISSPKNHHKTSNAPSISSSPKYHRHKTSNPSSSNFITSPNLPSDRTIPRTLQEIRSITGPRKLKSTTVGYFKLPSLNIQAKVQRNLNRNTVNNKRAPRSKQHFFGDNSQAQTDRLI